jgi:hypothetical protein
MVINTPRPGNGEEGSVIETAVQELLDLEEIKRLKSRYFRSVDAKDWEGFRAVFTEDIWFKLLDREPVIGADNVVTYTASATESSRTVHHGHMPDITIEGPTEARGIWSLADYGEGPLDSETGTRRGFKGYGQYEEIYRKVDGVWKIARLHLTYLRTDALYPEPLPSLEIT